MARFNEIVCGKPQEYVIVAADDTSSGNGKLLSVKNSSGRTEFNRVFVTNEDFEAYEIGVSTVTLVPWTMSIIPIKRLNANGEERTYRTLNGLAFSEVDAESAAMRSMQYMYDDATYIADSEEVRRIAKRDMLFANFVSRDVFLQNLADAD